MRCDEQLLNDLGLGALEPWDKREVRAVLVHTMEATVGTRIAEFLPDEAFTRFENLAQAQDRDAALTLLHENVPHYQLIIADQYERICIWFSAHARAILRSAPNPYQRHWST